MSQVEESLRTVTQRDISRAIEELTANRIAEGEESRLQIVLRQQLASSPKVGLGSAARILEDQQAENDVVVETLRALSELDGSRFRHAALALIQGALLSDDAYVRDAAGLLLTEMPDASSIPPLADAIEREPSAAIRQQLAYARKEIEESIDGVLPADGEVR